MNDTLGSPLERTAHFFNPNPRPNRHKLKPLSSDLSSPGGIPTFSRKVSQQETFDFGEVIAQELQKYNSQPSILGSISNFNNLKRNTNPMLPSSKTLLNIQQRLLFPKPSSSTSEATTSPEKGLRRNIRVVLNPFTQKPQPQTHQESRKSAHTSNSMGALRPSLSQGKRSFLQRKAQVKVLNRIFSSRSQHME